MKSNDFNISPYEAEKSLGIKEVLQSEEIIKAIEGKDTVSIGIFVGPEGGFAESENEKIKSEGIHSVSMGPRIFRTETASIAATVMVQYELGDAGICR